MPPLNSKPQAKSSFLVRIMIIKAEPRNEFDGSVSNIHPLISSPRLVEQAKPFVITIIFYRSKREKEMVNALRLVSFHILNAP
jgi:hypothetical protein